MRAEGPAMENQTEEISVLVCLSGSPSNQKVIKSAARFARANHRSLTALYVDNGKSDRAGTGSFLQSNMDYARSLGASVEVVRHGNVLDAIMEYAQDLAVTDLFIGYSGPSRKSRMRRLAVYRLVHQLPDVDIHIIPDASVQLTPSQLEGSDRHRLNGKDFLTTVVVMGTATVLSVLFDRSQFSNSNIITIYILAVLITAVMTAERIYGIIAAVLYILLFNFLFIEPRFSFLVYDPYYMVTYFVSVIAAVITGNISSRMKEISLKERSNAYQAQIMLNASEQLQRAGSEEEIAGITARQLGQLLRTQVVFYPAGAPEPADSEGSRQHPERENPQAQAGYPEQFSELSDADREALAWTMQNNKRAGRGTRHFPDADCLYLSVRIGNDMYGVIGVMAKDRVFTGFEENILLSLINECALSLESEKNRKEREDAQIVAENERFRSKLLRSVSHDLRTPLTSISGNTANLMVHGDELSEEEKQAIYTDVYRDSVWLIELVENLLSITRLEEQVEIHPVVEVVADVLQTAVNTARRHENSHTIVLDADELCLVAWMDVPLILQVVGNLISNAVKHTPAGTTIRIRDWREGNQVMVSVSDNGQGIPDADKSKIFDLFYTGTEVSADSSRSLGLGLSLCRSILDAHGQTIRVEDNLPCGTVFVFSLALAEEALDNDQ